MPRVRKYHNGGKGPGHPHSNLLPEVIVQSDEENGPESNSDAALSKLYEDKDEIIQSLLDRGLTSKQAEQSFNWLTDEIGLRGRGYTRKGKSIPPEELPILDFTSPATLDSLALVGFSSAMGSELLGSANRGDEDRWEIFHDIKDKYTEKAKKLDTYDEAVPFGDLTDWDFSTENREGESYPGVPGEDEFLFKDPIDFMPRGTPIPPNKRPQEPILELLKPHTIKRDLDKEVQASNISLPKTKYPTQRVMRYSNKVRTNQIPSHDMVWDKKRNQYVVRSIPQEEIDYYMKKNKVVKKPYVAPVYRKFNKGGKALKNLMKKYGAGGSVSDFGAQGNFTTKYTSNQPDVEELEDPNLILADVEELEDPNLILEENIIDAEAETEGQVPIAPMAEAENKVERAFSGAAKGVTVGSLLGPLGSLVGGAIGGVAGFLKGKKEKRRKRRQEGKDGMKIKKLMPSYQEGGEVSETEIDDGGLFQRLRDNRAERRINKTPVRQARTSELLDVLASDQPTTKGRYYPKEKEIVMYRDDDPDTLKHEQVHASQYGPLQRLAYSLKFNDSAKIQDPAKRRAYRKLTSGKNIVDDRQFNPAGQYVLSRGEEFEAVLDTGVNAAKEQGVDFSKSYDDILSQLLNAPSPTNNMTGLRKFMDNKFTKEQRDLILKSIR